ncbi:MAG: sugar transferase [Mycobacterium sp.]|nr:sugar transferase [Mycobacterium sp.]
MDPLSTIVTISIDVFSATVATAVGIAWASRAQDSIPPIWLSAFYVPVVIGLLATRQAYRRRLNRSFLDEVGPIETTVALASMMLLSTMPFFDGPGDDGGAVLKIWICAAVLMLLGRMIRAAIQRSLRRQHHLVAPTLIVGNGDLANKIIWRLRSSPEYGLDPIGLVHAEPPWTGFTGRGQTPSIDYLGGPDAIEQIITDTGAECIVIAFSRTSDEVLARVVRIAHQHGLRVWVVPRMFDVVGERAQIEHVGGLPLLALRHTDPRGWQFAIKHLLDRSLAAIGLLLTSPIFLTLMALVRLSSPGPIFFRQPRVGRDSRVFDCLKFRTMREATQSTAEFSLKDGAAPGGVEGVDRRTTIGKFLRSTSLDELPQLINVVKGEMSLVGPRPERPEFVTLFEAQIRRYGERHRVKSGMTGFAQVHGLRGQSSIADRAEWDNYYIENWSLALDLKILAMTVPAMFRGE